MLNPKISESWSSIKVCSWLKVDRIRTDALPTHRLSMRPSILNPLFAAAANLPGIGPKNAKLLDRLSIDGSRHSRVVATQACYAPRSPLDQRTPRAIIQTPVNTLFRRLPATTPLKTYDA
jgi:hypothetical protein